jgi:hypothetical protein
MPSSSRARARTLPNVPDSSETVGDYIHSNESNISSRPVRHISEYVRTLGGSGAQKSDARQAGAELIGLPQPRASLSKMLILLTAPISILLVLLRRKFEA